MGRARRDLSRAFLWPPPGQVWTPRALPGARPRETRYAGCFARGAYPRAPSPTPGVRAGAPADGGGERSPGGARATSQPALPRSQGRARADQRRPPLSARPSSRLGRWGRGCRHQSPVTPARKRPIRSRLPSGTVTCRSPCFRKRKEDDKKSLRGQEPPQLLPGSD